MKFFYNTRTPFSLKKRLRQLAHCLALTVTIAWNPAKLFGSATESGKAITANIFNSNYHY